MGGARGRAGEDVTTQEREAAGEASRDLGLPDTGPPRFPSVGDVRQGLAGVDYLADEGIAGVVYLADRLAKPVLVEGPAGTGKTELAKSVARLTGSRLIRLQCYEGLDESKALYEWNYRKQLLRIQASQVVADLDVASRTEPSSTTTWESLEEDIFSEEFLLTRPLLEAIRAEEPVVLLIDEVDRVELETEALMLEILSEYQVSIPELGTVRAARVPMVFLTSNNTRELSEALKRRCLYLHLDYPDLEREPTSSGPGSPGSTASWRSRWRGSSAPSGRSSSASRPQCPRHSTGRGTLVVLGIESVDAATARDTLHILLKYQTDIERAAKELLTAER